MRRRAAVLTLALVVLGPAAAAFAETDWEQPAPGYDWSFPRDHFSHPDYRTEWWYFTGHLETTSEPRRRFGYQFTIFRVGLDRRRAENESIWSATDLVMGHAALGDLDRGEHRFTEVVYREVPFLAAFAEPSGEGDAAGAELAWTRGPVGTGEVWRLTWNGNGFDFDAVDTARRFSLSLSTRATKPLVFQGPGGFSRKSDVDDGVSSLYYSFTRLETSGSVRIDDERLQVVGESWMDKEFSSAHLARHQSGWDWFSLQLEDGREVMLYQLRDEAGGLDFAQGTLVDASGVVVYLAPSDFDVRVTRRWTSQRTGARYPSGWAIALAAHDLTLTVTPEFDAQENVGERTGLAYWEGAVVVRDADGRPVGRGYVELTGYGGSRRSSWEAGAHPFGKDASR